MSALTPTEEGLRLLEALALPTQDQHPDRTGWWSYHDLRADPRTHPHFGHKTQQKVHGLAQGLVRQGYARSRQIGTRGHGWTEYRITSLGRGYLNRDGNG